MGLDFLPPPSTEEYRILTQDEIKTVEPIFTERGANLPDPSISCFVGCVVGGEVVAFVVLQLKLHAQPLWIKEGHPHKLSGLAHAAESVIITRAGSQWVYLFSPAGKLAQMAQVLGMQLEPWVVLSKYVTLVPSGPISTLESTELNVQGEVR